MRKVRLQIEPASTAAHDAEYVIFLAAWNLAENLVELLRTHSPNTLTSILAYLGWLKVQEKSWTVAHEASPLYRRLLTVLDRLRLALSAMQQAAIRRNSRWFVDSQKTIGAIGAELAEIAKAAQQIYRA